MESMDGTEGTERTKGTGEKTIPCLRQLPPFPAVLPQVRAAVPGTGFRPLRLLWVEQAERRRRRLLPLSSAGERGCAKDRGVCRVCEKRKTRGKPIKGFPLVSACEKIVP